MLPTACVRAASLEPNIQDKGRASKHLWFGRVWEYRALQTRCTRRATRRPERERAQLGARVRRTCHTRRASSTGCARSRNAGGARPRAAPSLAFLELFDSAACNGAASRVRTARAA